MARRRKAAGRRKQQDVVRLELRSTAEVTPCLGRGIAVVIRTRSLERHLMRSYEDSFCMEKP